MKPQTLLNRPWIFARSSIVKMSPITVIVIGCTAPAPMPCTARKRISCSMFCATPQSTEPSEEDGAAGEQHRLAAVEVGQLAVQGHGYGRGEQVDGEHPAKQRECRRGFRRWSVRAVLTIVASIAEMAMANMRAIVTRTRLLSFMSNGRHYRSE